MTANTRSYSTVSGVAPTLDSFFPSSDEMSVMIESTTRAPREGIEEGRSISRVRERERLGKREGSASFLPSSRSPMAVAELFSDSNALGQIGQSLATRVLPRGRGNGASFYDQQWGGYL